MKELVEVIAKALVDNPDEVVVTESENDDELVIELKVAPSDMGKVIGKQGRIAKAIRSVVKAASSRLEKKVRVEITFIKYWGQRNLITVFFVRLRTARQGHGPLCAGSAFERMEQWKICFASV